MTDETRFYHPNFIAEFLTKTKDKVVGAALVTKILPKNSIEIYLRNNWHYLKPMEITKLAFRKNLFAFKDYFLKKSRDRIFYSVRSVYKHFDIKFFDVEYDINKRTYIEKIRKVNPDIIVTSNSLIFKEELINLPSICCLNRHSSLLPSYRGLWPVFQAYRNGEKYTGVSIHTMTERIDKGVVLAYKKLSIEPKETIVELYEKCFDVSSDLLIKALDKIRNKDLTPCNESNKPSYFSFPKKEHWDEFRKRGGRLI